jgi:trehalose 6-phosphate phosphatase
MISHALSSLPTLDRILSGENRILIAAGFDGVLCSATHGPLYASVERSTLELLRQLAESPRIILAILSGRAIEDLAARLRLPAVFAGNDGLAIRAQNFDFVHPEARRLRPVLESACSDIATALAAWPSAWVQDRQYTATVHYGDVDVREQHQVVIAIRKSMARYAGLVGMRAGSKCMDLRPRIPWNRGSALNYIKVKTGISDSCICIGSDRADEAMLGANRTELNVQVGAGTNRAGLFISDWPDVKRLLARVLDFAGSRQASGAGRLLQAACV